MPRSLLRPSFSCGVTVAAALATTVVAASAQETPASSSGVSLTGPSPPASPQAAPVNPSVVSLTGPSPAAPVPYAPLPLRTGGGASSAPAKEAAAEPTTSDHDLVVHHIAVGYFGISQLPVGTPGTAGAGGANTVSSTVNAPVIGVRYWASRSVGIDLGFGFGYAHNATNGGTGTTSSTSSTWGLAFHAGLPISLGSSKHFSFELVPIEVTLGPTGGKAPALTETEFGMTTSGGIESLSGFRVDVGARIGAELQFGFIGIPQLALEGSIGLYVQHESWGASLGGAPAVGGNQTTFSTSVGSDPWAIFTDTIAALYYF
jgi:hypothetical protein